MKWLWIRLALTIPLIVGYGVSFSSLQNTLGENHNLIALALVAVIASLWGRWFGLVAGALLWIGHHGYATFLSTGDWGLPWPIALDRIFEPITFVVFGIVFGYLNRLSSQLRVHRKAFTQAQYDALTGLLNRTAFERRLADSIDDAQQAGSHLAVLFVDLDRFKFVNDTFGHEMGDELLKEVAGALKENVRQNDIVARLGGDEFIMALQGMRDRSAASVIARKLVAILSSPFEIRGKVLHVSASIGIAMFPKDGEDVASLTKNADSAMYQVKEAGKNSFNFSNVEMRTKQSRQLQLERAMRWALQENELELRYQPQIELASNTLVGFETLMRWNNRELGFIPPDEFIPIAEDAGLIVPIGHWLLREACHQAVAWQRAGYRPVKISVNVSTLQFRQPEFLQTVAGAIDDSGLNPELLEIEITESVLMKDYERAGQTLKRLARIGVNAALDDFGTGYSSLAYLQKLPISTLKIDRSFVSALLVTPSGYAGSTVPIVEAICAMARKLGKTVIAEGIENEAQRQYLVNIGCTQGQGFLLSKPIQPREAGELLASVTESMEEDPIESETSQLLLRD